jgi:hypothetical protein
LNQARPGGFQSKKHDDLDFLWMALFSMGFSMDCQSWNDDYPMDGFL